LRASVERNGEGEALARLQLADGSGQAVARIGGLRAEGSEPRRRSARRRRGEAQHLYRLEWRPVALSEAGPESAAADGRRRPGELAGASWS